MVVISEPGFLVVTWTFFAIGTVLTVLRLYVRQTKLRGLGWDDLLHCMAWTVLLGLVALETSVNHLIFKVSNVTSGRTSLTASFLEDEVPHYIVVQLAIMLLTWTTTWAVKASFLLFYRGLLRNTGRYMIAWWLVTIFTGLAYISVFFPIIFTCGSPADYFSIDACLSPHSIERTKGNVGYTTAVDITTDLMIMTLPLRMLWGLRVTRRQKLTLAATFSLASIIIIIAMVQLIETLNTLTPKGTFSLVRADPVGVDFWNILEACMAVIVSCLPSFRVLFNNSQRQEDQDRRKPRSRNYQKAGVSKDGDNLKWKTPWFRLPGATNAGETETDFITTQGVQDTQKTLVATELSEMGHVDDGPDDVQQSGATNDAQAAARHQHEQIPGGTLPV